MAKHTFTIEFDADTFEATVQDKTFQMPMDKIHPSWARYIWNYGFQRVVNDYANRAGKDGTVGQKHEAAKARLADFESEYVGRVSSAADPHAKFRKYIRAMLRKSIKDSAAYKAADDKSAYLDSIFDAQTDDVRDTILKRAKVMYDQEHGGLDIAINV